MKTNAKKAPALVTEVLEMSKEGTFVSHYFLPHEFEGKKVIFRGDGYINMTLAAKEFGKDIKEFFSNKGTKGYISALSKIGGIPPNIVKQATRGRNGVTFGHPKLAVFFARWLDVRFAVWCDLMIDNILRGNIQTQVVVPTLEAEKLQAETEALRTCLRLELDRRALEEVKKLQEEGFKGLVPDGWMTAWCFLGEKGILRKYVKPLSKWGRLDPIS